METMKGIWRFGVMALIATAAMAQNSGLNYSSTSQLHQMAAKLKQQESIRTTGSAAETLEKYPNHFTMLTVRTASGGAEVHEHYADLFWVIDGNATLITGGTVLNPRSAGSDETRGTAISGGDRQKLSKGDVVHISPNTPHQLLISKGHSFTYFVVKVME
jgi:mannose-6-phosphate isomerase-like protein (cupin superfamily)